MNGSEQVVLLTGDEAVVDAVLAASAALAVPTAVVADVDEAMRRWASAEVVLGGGDRGAALAQAAPRPRPRTYLVGYDAEELGAWSLPLAAQVIPLPHGLAWLTAALSADAGRASPVIAVTGGSGGVGASTLAAGMALEAAARGRPAALVDVDPLGGGLDLLLGAERAPGWRWPRLLGARGEVSDVRQFLPTIEGVTLVSTARRAGSDAGAQAQPGPEALEAVLGSLARHHDVVVVDTGRSPTASMRRHLRMANLTLLVCATDVRSVAAASHAAHHLELASPRVVVRQRRGLGAPPERVADALGLGLAGALPDEPRLARAAQEGDLPGRWRGSAWRRAVRDVLDVALEGVPDAG